MIEVVCGLVIKHGRILLQQRSSLKDFPFLWECPGGKVEENESHHQALRRELLEELGIDIGELPAAQRPVWSWTFENKVARPDRASVLLHFYAIGDRFSGTPSPRESQPGMGWFLPHEMMGIDLAPANHRACEEIEIEIRRETERR